MQVSSEAWAEWQRMLGDILARAIRVAENAIKVDNEARACHGIRPRRLLTAEDVRGGRE